MTGARRDPSGTPATLAVRQEPAGRETGRGAGRGMPGGAVTAIVIALALAAAALVAYNASVCATAGSLLVGEPAASYDMLVRLVALDLGAAVILALAVLFGWGRQAQRRRHREAGHARALARERAAFENALDPMLFFDDGGRIESMNRAAATMFRRADGSMVGEPIHRFVRCGTLTGEGRFEPLALDTTTGSEALRADGEIVPIECRLTRPGDGSTLVVVRDVSERHLAEERVREIAEGLEATNRRLEEANLQLEEASRLKSEFLANTSHELRTPLNGMIGFLQLVLDDMCDSPEEEREFLLQALECSRHLLGLINDVLDIAKIEAGKLTLELEPVDVAALFGEIYTLTHVQAKQKGLALRCEPPEAATHRVRADFGKAKQVLVNLVGNSLKFTSRGGITVRATERPDLGHTMFEVIDTGIGVPQNRQRVIFEKFTQVDGSTTRKYGGTGLGLAISKSLIELMGGVIGIESAGPGAGTRVFFSLPIWRAEEETEDVPSGDEEGVERSEVAETHRVEGPSGGALVMIVEDDRVFTKFLSTLLQRHGYRTVSSSSAESAWVLVRRLRPAAMLLDYALTSAQGASLRTGWDLAERMASNPRTRHIPLIFVTGFDTLLKERLKTTALAQTPHHLMKPVEGRTLVAKIDELVGPSHRGVIRVLMADDDPSVAAYVRKVLPQDRFHIEVANNGEECLHILRMQPRAFDLLLLDLMMPDVSGYDVLRELSLSDEERALPVLILTNFPEARDEEEKRLLERGLVLDVLAKSTVHENPVLLPHIIDWHMQVVRELRGASGSATDEPWRAEAA